LGYNLLDLIAKLQKKSNASYEASFSKETVFCATAASVAKWARVPSLLGIARLACKLSKKREV